MLPVSTFLDNYIIRKYTFNSMWFYAKFLPLVSQDQHIKTTCVFINLVVFFSFNIPLVKAFRFFFIPLVFTPKTTQPLVFFVYLVIAFGWYLVSNVLRSKIICYHSLTTHLYLVSKSALQSHVKTFQTLPTNPTIFLWFTNTNLIILLQFTTLGISQNN